MFSLLLEWYYLLRRILLFVVSSLLRIASTFCSLLYFFLMRQFVTTLSFMSFINRSVGVECNRGTSYWRLSITSSFYIRILLLINWAFTLSSLLSFSVVWAGIEVEYSTLIGWKTNKLVSFYFKSGSFCLFESFLFWLWALYLNVSYFRLDIFSFVTHFGRSGCKVRRMLWLFRTNTLALSSFR